MATVFFGDYEWESEKAEANVRDHDGVSFEEAATVLDAHGTLDLPDREFPTRANTVGFSLAGNLLLVVSSEEEAETDRTRIISARHATPAERRDYAAHQGE